MRAISARIRHGWGVVFHHQDKTGGIMKRIIIVLALAATFASTAVAQRVTSYAIGNEHNLKIVNLFPGEYHQYFDNAKLAKDFLAISEFYGLSTDFEIGINPTATMMWVTIQGIEFDPAKVPKLALVKDGDEYYLPLKLQADTCIALYSYIQRYIDYSDAPRDIREKARRLSLQSFKFMTGITHDNVTLEIRGGIAANRMFFEPQIQLKDLTNWKAPIFLTIKMPTAHYYMNRLVPEGLMFLETPEDSKNPLITKDSYYIFKFFGIR
jgi:hypothetical protein